MKFLVVILWLVNGEPRAADVLGTTVDEDSCKLAASDALVAHKASVEQLVEQGVRPYIYCAPLPELPKEKQTL